MIGLAHCLRGNCYCDLLARLQTMDRLMSRLLEANSSSKHYQKQNKVRVLIIKTLKAFQWPAFRLVRWNALIPALQRKEHCIRIELRKNSWVTKIVALVRWATTKICQLPCRKAIRVAMLKSHHNHKKISIVHHWQLRIHAQLLDLRLTFKE